MKYVFLYHFSLAIKNGLAQCQVKLLMRCGRWVLWGVYVWNVCFSWQESGLSHESMGFKSSNYDNLPFHSCVQAALWAKYRGGEGENKVSYFLLCLCFQEPHSSEYAAGSSLPQCATKRWNVQKSGYAVWVKWPWTLKLTFAI